MGKTEPSEWQALYGRLLDVLSAHGVHDAFGDGDFFLIDDYYGSRQHKVECSSVAAVTPDLLAAIQQLLCMHPSGWEVILALPSRGGREHAFVIKSNGYVEHSA